MNEDGMGFIARIAELESENATLKSTIKELRGIIDKLGHKLKERERVHRTMVKIARDEVATMCAKEIDNIAQTHGLNTGIRADISAIALHIRQKFNITKGE